MTRSHYEGRVLGSLATACIGDALGAPTEQRTITEIRALWGGRVERFETPPPESPFAKGRAAGQITDDASQMLALVDAYIESNGRLTAVAVATALLRWADDEEYSRFMGPSTRAGIERLRAGGDPTETGRAGRLTTEGTSNGAAMRIASVGLAHPGDLEGAVSDAVIACLPTHATTLAISGAAAVAGAIAIAMEPDARLMDVIRAARRGAALGATAGLQHGRDVAGPTVVARLDRALELVVNASDFDHAIERLAGGVGTGLHISEAVPAALAIFLAADGDPFLTVVGGANAGDDTDTVACIAGSIAGAFKGIEAVPQDLYEQVEAANHLRLAERASTFTRIVLESARA